MTELFDEITRVVSATNDAYMAGYRDAKLELRRRLRIATEVKEPDPADQACKLLAITAEFIDV